MSSQFKPNIRVELPLKQHGISVHAVSDIRWIRWRPSALDVDLMIDGDAHVWIHSIRPKDAHVKEYNTDTELAHALPIVQIRLLGEGSTYGTSERLVFSATPQRLSYVSHTEWQDGHSHFLKIEMHDKTADIAVQTQFGVFFNVPVLRSTVFVKNEGRHNVFLQAVASLSLGYLNRGHDEWWKEYEVWFANSTNFREAQWKAFEPGDLGMDYVGASDFHKPGTRASIVKSNLGTFSTCGSLPMGALSRKDGKQCYMWQIEHSGSWRWELGNILHGLYVIAGGPNDQDHQWTKKLEPGEEFESVSTALAVISGKTEDAFDAFTRYRRGIRRRHADNQTLPVVFNDYMNCLDGDPNEQKVLALIQPARRLGAEYFCIDAGWYADVDDWWDCVGEWKPSRVRFPRGLNFVLDTIKDAGMKPGLWMEPEVIGIKSPVAAALPDGAFFQRLGRRVVEQSRYHLDFRHTAVTTRLNNIIDGLVNDLGVQYFKFDANIDVTHGTDFNASSPGDGMLEHRRAYMAWINRLYDRFPDLVIESCSSGGQRLDYHTLATHSIQSTSDQTNPVIYSAISANILTALTPEQSASWALPAPEYDDDTIALCMVNSLMGRLYISGRIDLLTDSQLQLVIEASDVYKSIRADIPNSVPFWPIGLHAWHQDWLVLGLKTVSAMYLAVWRRGGLDSFSFQLLEAQEHANFSALYPKRLITVLKWHAAKKQLSVTIPTFPSARLISVA
ncbi:hypothetical protein AC578_10701 [Pseudocercospora eumusae]|uniref:alpha-galactosidase n=1 Tax=Pseudocercospora eumusae TaxID=321146 RepID=A0A139HJQ2_9PEZI|nr:hypothetical protein AC578_10701 [Pseudocercospora eumusae]